jgi:outer membrane protein assembly factor BamE (lipoprotein component of BamABCDE complex)
LRYLCGLSIVLCLQGCSQGLEPHGIFLSQEEAKSLSHMNRSSLEQKFGKPQYTSSFNPKKVYYIGYQTERFYVKPNVITQRSAIEVIYDDKGNITSINSIDLKPQNITPSSEQVPNPEMDIDWKAIFDTGSPA